MTTQTDEFKPPHGFCVRTWRRVQDTFEHGGLVTCYQADAYLQKTRGFIKDQCLAGNIPYAADPRGKGTVFKVHTNDVMRLFGPVGPLRRIA